MGENDMRRLNQQIMACVVIYNLLKIENIPDSTPLEDILGNDMLTPAWETTMIDMADQGAAEAEVEAMNDEENKDDDDDGKVVVDSPWRFFNTAAEEARYERVQRI
jgi:hypothetical protein